MSWRFLLKDLIHLIGSYFQSPKQLVRLDGINKHWHDVCKHPLVWKNAIASDAGKCDLTRVAGFIIYDSCFAITKVLPQVRIFSGYVFNYIHNLANLCPNLTLLDLDNRSQSDATPLLPDFTQLPNLTALQISNVQWSDNAELLSYLLKNMKLLSCVKKLDLKNSLKFEVPSLQWIGVDFVSIPLIRDSLCMYSRHIRELHLSGLNFRNMEMLDMTALETLHIDQCFPFLCSLTVQHFALSKKVSEQIAQLRYLQHLRIDLSISDKNGADYLADILLARKDSLEMFVFAGNLGPRCETLFQLLANMSRLIFYQIDSYDKACAQKRLYYELFRNHPTLIFARVREKLFDRDEICDASLLEWWKCHVPSLLLFSIPNKYTFLQQLLQLIKDNHSVSRQKVFQSINLEDPFIFNRSLYSTYQQLVQWNKFIAL